MMKKIGVLALQGGVEEHINALLNASEKINEPVQVVEVRLPEDTEQLDGIILPGGESTAISRMMERAQLFEPVRRIRKIMGTCAGAILLAKKVEGAIPGQRFLSLMDIAISRNAYGSQKDSFEAALDTKFGKVNGVFIRAPKITMLAGEHVRPLAFFRQEIVAAYQSEGERHFLATTFHPELTTTKFHEFFIKL
ncbi:MAG: pyridoxal 5'-phosphate synthase glutaminase subunit PdxT [Candidatus Micrarchaeota archaeon]|nr:pyridoxal 5'-phosphate synthase glutaminase subunit PdxT [Candidatus Micrarchaeota archaeon]